MDDFGRLIYQDFSDKIVAIELHFNSEYSHFVYHESSRGEDALTAEPNTQIVVYSFYRIADNTPQFVYYLQTNGSNIVEYRFEDYHYTGYTTRVVYAG